VHARRPLRLQVKGGPRRALPRAGHDLRVEARLDVEVAEREPLLAKGGGEVVVLVLSERAHSTVARGGGSAQPVEARDVLLLAKGVLALDGEAQHRAEHGDGDVGRHVDRTGDEGGARVGDCDGAHRNRAGEAGEGLANAEVKLRLTVSGRAHGQRLAQQVHEEVGGRRGLEHAVGGAADGFGSR